MSQNDASVYRPGKAAVAYFSMEIGLESDIPTYSGGLGGLAGDTIRAAADLGVPMVAVSLVYRQGYMRQHLDPYGNQTETPSQWDPATRLEPLRRRIAVEIEGRSVRLRAWRYLVRGIGGHIVPVYLLDSDVRENNAQDRQLTGQLYGGDERYRLCQETILGLGGLEFLRALGYKHLGAYHMNEGHSALLGLGLLESQSAPDAVHAVRKQCIFTTHTPVPAGHDQFSVKLAREILGNDRIDRLIKLGCCDKKVLNMTHVALFFSRFVNGVAMRHGEISRKMFPKHPIGAITNGIHAATWAVDPVARLLDAHIPDWRNESANLRYAVALPLPELDKAHREAKRQLFQMVEARRGVALDPDALTLGFARRATAYKRADLLFSDPEQLKHISRHGRVQLIYAGKAHPRDKMGKDMIRRVFEAASELGRWVDVVYLENYDMDTAKLLCGGVDVWVNTPRKPQEASGTSGMKAALNGVPSLSVLDGWWIEGHVENVTGWAIGDDWEPSTDEEDAAALYQKLERVCAMYYGSPRSFSEMRRYSIALNASFFNAQRMMQQYAHGAYHLAWSEPVRARDPSDA